MDFKDPSKKFIHKILSFMGGPGAWGVLMYIFILIPNVSLERNVEITSDTNESSKNKNVNNLMMLFVSRNFFSLQPEGAEFREWRFRYLAK